MNWIYILLYGIKNNYLRYCCRYICGHKRMKSHEIVLLFSALKLGGKVRYKIKMENVYLTLKFRILNSILLKPSYRVLNWANRGATRLSVHIINIVLYGLPFRPDQHMYISTYRTIGVHQLIYIDFAIYRP